MASPAGGMNEDERKARRQLSSDMIQFAFCLHAVFECPGKPIGEIEAVRRSFFNDVLPKHTRVRVEAHDALIDAAEDIMLARLKEELRAGLHKVDTPAILVVGPEGETAKKENSKKKKKKDAETVGQTMAETLEAFAESLLKKKNPGGQKKCQSQLYLLISLSGEMFENDSFQIAAADLIAKAGLPVPPSDGGSAEGPSGDVQMDSEDGEGPPGSLQNPTGNNREEAAAVPVAHIAAAAAAAAGTGERREGEVLQQGRNNWSISRTVAQIFSFVPSFPSLNRKRLHVGEGEGGEGTRNGRSSAETDGRAKHVRREVDAQMGPPHSITSGTIEDAAAPVRMVRLPALGLIGIARPAFGELHPSSLSSGQNQMGASRLRSLPISPMHPAENGYLAGWLGERGINVFSSLVGLSKGLSAHQIDHLAQLTEPKEEGAGKEKEEDETEEEGAGKEKEDNETENARKRELSKVKKPAGLLLLETAPEIWRLLKNFLSSFKVSVRVSPQSNDRVMHDFPSLIAMCFNQQPLA
uniref:Uncharacterized protein n=1 Tax=Chromera velia CCMP2878 TaxID=1169474 RepID=A0A0G4GCC0_9ALVE|eukprot:Cvel_4513.t1-p1 / transcript=Cvel_4513.t1 / gene=Cvel_4513 / organism=Chromera_velia_CCMP2878 / gene_product=hypothetical protein / transcript_product=hypothetical protein / location=Cvel_scaffold197:88532-93153(-) / protein_length=524 / sequence_SO=supercontig / SO=protein_coding / is_pseudo=false